MSYFVKPEHRAAAVTSPIPVNESLPRTCVIGAGSSGIAAAKALYLAGVPFDCYESGSAIGGNWLLDNPNGLSACYETLEINTSCPRMAFSDFPMPEDYPAYAGHEQVHAYFEDYVDHFGFRHTITFNTEVQDVARDVDGGWLVRTRGPEGEQVHRYDAVLVANGHHWDPRWPEPAYPGTFDGEQIHAHDYRSGEQLQDRHVVVVGAGNSAMDIAVEASFRAKSTALSIRRGQWVMRKFLLGRPSDQVTVPAWLPWPATALRLRIGALTAGGFRKYGLPTPPHKPGQSHPVQSEQIRARIAAGRVCVRPGIARFDGDTVVFTDGTRSPADLIVWATGYKISFPFLDPALVSVAENELPLWKRTVHPDLPGLFFIGLVQPVGAVMPLSEAQGAWVAETLAGRYAPPSDGVIREQMTVEDQRNKKQFYASPRHTMEVDFDHYLWDLERERIRGRQRAHGRTTGRTSRATDLTGRVVAVTGGANGIGREIASLLASVGAKVAIGDRDGAAAARVAREIDGELLGVDLDVTDSDSFASFFSTVESVWGPIDVLVNNAGVMWVGPFEDEPEAAAVRQIAVNLLGVIRGVKLAAPAMVARGSGHIITIASAASLLTTPGEASYAASKHGVLGYLKAVRAELHRSAVKLSVIMPAVVNTALAAGTDTGAAKMLQPADVAAAVLRTIDRPRFEVTIPAYISPLVRVINVLPEGIRDGLFRRLVPNQARHADRQARAAYEGQFGEPQ